MANSFAIDITNDSAQTPNGNNNYVFLLENITGSDFWNNVKSDGGDLRIYHSASNERVAMEVVYIDSGSTSGEIHFHSSHSAASTSTDWRLEWGDGTLDQPAVTNEFGRNNVWGEFEAVFHLNETGSTYVDATGNGHTANDVNSPANTTANNPFGRNWKDFSRGSSGNDDVIRWDTSGSLDNQWRLVTYIMRKDSGNANCSISDWTIADGQSNAYVFNAGSGTNGQRVLWRKNNTAYNTPNSTIASNGVVYQQGMAVQPNGSGGSYLIDYLAGNRDARSSHAADIRTTSNSGVELIGSYYEFSNRGWDGQICEVKYRIGDVGNEDAIVEEENNNLLNNSSFWTTSEIYSIGTAPITGGSESTVNVSADGGGEQTGLSGGAESSVNISATGGGQKVTEPNLWAIDIESDASLVVNGNDEYLLSLDNITDDTFWNEIQSGGGDLEIYHSASNERVALDIINIDSASKSGEIHFHSSHSISGSSTIWRIEFGSKNKEQQTPTGSFGRNQVWSNYEIVFSMDSTESVDRTGNGYQFETVNGNPQPEDAIWGKGLRFNNTDDFIEIPSGPLLQRDEPSTVSLWCSGSDVSNSTRLFGSQTGSAALKYEQADNTGKLGLDSADGGQAFNINTPFDRYAYITFQMFQNEFNDELATVTLDGSQSDTLETISTTGFKYIANKTDSSETFRGVINHITLALTKFSQSKIEEEYYVQSDNGSFWTISESYALDVSGVSNVIVTAEGAGSVTLDGGAESTVNISAVGDGFVTLDGGAESIINVSADASGRKEASDGSESQVNITEDGAGTKEATNGSESTVNISATGAGTDTQLESGGAESTVNVSATGAGIEVREGGAESTVNVSAEAVGQKEITSGSESTVNVSTDANGFKTILLGSESQVDIIATGDGIQGIFSGAESTVNISGDGAGTKEALSGAVSIVSISTETGTLKLISDGAESQIDIIASANGVSIGATIDKNEIIDEIIRFKEYNQAYANQMQASMDIVLKILNNPRLFD